MDFQFINFKLPLFVSMLLAMALSAVAQSGQSIIFSKPADAGGDSTEPVGAPANIPGLSDPQNFANQFNAPASLFKTALPPDELPPPSQFQTLSAAEQRQFKKILDDKRNWMLLTPEEIFGVTTPEKILQSQNSPDDKEKSLTPMERFLKRQEDTRRQMSGTNGAFGGRDLTVRNPFLRTEESPDGSRIDSRRATTATAPSLWKQIFNPLPDNNSGATAANPNNPTVQPNPFGLNAQPPPPSKAQIAEMQRFREMLMPSTTPAEKAAQASPGGKFLLATPTATPTATPIFNSVTPVNGVSTKLAELTPVTGLSGQSLVKPTVTTKPSWAPQPPPWLSQTPQPFVAPQRQF